MSSGTTASSRPTVSGKEDTPLGKSFTITFEADQRLPTHSNPARVVISVVRGSGSIALTADPARSIAEGDFVQLEPNEPHAVTAGSDGLQLVVTMVENCCRMC